MLEYELKFMLQAPYDPKGNYSTNQNTAHAIQRIKWAHMQQKLTKTEGHSPELGLRAHRAALQPKLGVVGAHMGSADHMVGRPAHVAIDLASWREASQRIP